jgi:hypothetical protein
MACINTGYGNWRSQTTTSPRRGHTVSAGWLSLGTGWQSGEILCRGRGTEELREVLAGVGAPGRPGRLIELKAATCRRRKPSVSWNEWTTARNEWIQARDDPLYYLYIVGHLSKSTAPDPYIRTVPNPFRLLDAQVEHDVNIERSIQVDVNRFSEEEPVLEIPVEIKSTDP